jgi:hypothetical protein
MLPAFYKHCVNLSDGLDLLFAHRWILLCFKREFPERGIYSIINFQKSRKMIDDMPRAYPWDFENL